MPNNALVPVNLLGELRAFLRSESATRKAWRRRAWLGRRLAFARVEAYVYGQWWCRQRADAATRMAFVDRILDILEECCALDVVSAGSYADEVYEDAVMATAVDVSAPWRQEAPEAAPILRRRVR